MAFVDFRRHSSLFNFGSGNTDTLPSFTYDSTTSSMDDPDPAYNLKNHSVLVDIECFMRSVLHIPPDWRTQWGPVIHAIKRNPDFMKHYLDYWVLHEKEIEELESRHYEPLLLMSDITLRGAFPTTFSENRTSAPPPLTQFIHILEDSSPHRVLNDGKSSPHLATKEEQQPPIPQPLPNESAPSPRREHPPKRERSRSPNPECKRRKLGVASASGQVNLETGWDSRFPPQESEPKQSIEVGGILVDLLSLHPHITTALVDGHNIQFYHANHSVVLVSSVVDLSLQDCEDSIDKFVAILIAFHRLYLYDEEIFHRDQKATMLRLQGDTTVKGPVEIELGRCIYASHILVKRATGVMYGTSPTWPGSPLVVKISWVKASLVSEQDFMDKATEEAGKPGHEWALNHLPRFFYVEDVHDPTYRSVDELLKNARFKNGEYTYVRHKMRVMVQEPLQPLETLTNVKDVGQVLLDVACIHRWLYDRPGILHGDLSLRNIMCRTIRGKVYGVLADYDLSSWKTPSTTEDVNTSQGMTGTVPFMACDLLDPYKTDTRLVRLYRHDVESFFYVMLILATHYEIREPGEGEDGGVREREGKLQFQDWFEQQSDRELGHIKYCWLWRVTREPDFEPSPSFKGLEFWLRRLKSDFLHGFFTRNQHRFSLDPILRSCGMEDVPLPCDEETLGGYITYSSIIRPVPDFPGELQGLVIRYDPPQIQPSTSTDESEAHA